MLMGFGNRSGSSAFGAWLGALLCRQYDQHTGIGVTSPIAWSPDATRLAYGTYGRKEPSSSPYSRPVARLLDAVIVVAQG